MAEATPLISNFTAGEVSPLLAGRHDLAWYKNATRRQENMVSVPHGAAVKRPGTVYVRDAKDHLARGVLIPFVFSIDQAYMIEAGNLVFRFGMDRGTIESAPDVPLELTTPYLTADLPSLNWAQSYDVLIIVGATYRPRILSRLSHTSWSLDAITFTDGPYFDENTDLARSFTPSGVTGAITIDAGGHAPFAATDVGRLIRLKHGSTWGYAEITAYLSSTKVNALVRSDFGATTTTTTWQLGLWSDTTGWPTAVTFHGNRLWFGGASNQPNRADGSTIGDFYNFTPGVDDDDPLAISIVADRVPAIQWLRSLSVLLAGTNGVEFNISADSLNSPLTPTNIQAGAESRYGSAAIPPEPMAKAVLFVQRAGRKLRELYYNADTNGYDGADLTRRAEHLFTRNKQIERIAFQQEPWSLVWTERSDGMLCGMTYVREEKVVAWHRHPLGGRTDEHAWGEVESIASIPGVGEDELHLMVKRTINNRTVRFVEILEPFYDDDDAAEDLLYMDAALIYSGAAATVFTNLGHLEGESVGIVAEGAVLPSQTVVGGSITLPRAYSTVQFGLVPTARLMPVRPDAGALTGTAQGKKKRIVRTVVRVHRSAGFKIGRSEATLTIVPTRNSAEAMDAPPSLFTGDTEVSFSGNFDADGDMLIVSDQPLPLTVVALMPQLEVNEG